MENISNKTCYSKQQTRIVQTTYQKIDNVQRNWNRQPTKHYDKRYNLKSSSYQNVTLLISDILTALYFFLEQKDVFDIKSGTKKFTTKSRLEEINIIMKV